MVSARVTTTALLSAGVVLMEGVATVVVVVAPPPPLLPPHPVKPAETRPSPIQHANFAKEYAILTLTLCIIFGRPSFNPSAGEFHNPLTNLLLSQDVREGKSAALELSGKLLKCRARSAD